ncbi:hypothetical protein CICLE_v10029192mg [Citrus x clementina]|uniref:HMA domain-containing protein n=2 Tax=Citrus clementina TaxID=85681 RepID=V4SBS9_CITCL|nr:hypothetical protein CICLE_v10029192mg [Citrus x clementina]
MVRHNGHRPIDHHHHHRHNRKPYAPCSSQLPIIPKPYSISNHDHHQKSSRKISAKQTDHLRRKSSADITDLNGDSSYGSSRYLLSDKPFTDWKSESDHHATALARSQSAKPKLVTSSNDSPSLKSFSTNKSRDKVVVLRVSIHCKGCEGKVRKHISKMEGVTSFSIDLATKKVTIIGDVTPSGVLASVSSVKKAQFWPSSTSASSSPSSPVVDMTSYRQN